MTFVLSRLLNFSGEQAADRPNHGHFGTMADLDTGKPYQSNLQKGRERHIHGQMSSQHLLILDLSNRYRQHEWRKATRNVSLS